MGKWNKNGHQGTNANQTFDVIEDCRVYRSYAAIIAFSHKGKCYWSENNWSQTTGKHISAFEQLNGFSASHRMTHDDFVKKYNELVLGDGDRNRDGKDHSPMFGPEN